MNWGWKLGESVSTFGPDIDSIYYLILWITGVIFVIVEVALIVFIIRYRGREGRTATYTHGNRTAEVVWTAVPFLLVVLIVYMSNGVWLSVKRPPDTLDDPLSLRVAAKQFEWNVTYPGPDGELDTADDFVKRNQLHLPVGRPVRIDLTSEDVIHSLFLPEFRVKQDAVPGMTIPVWFEATETGEFSLACAELCGLGHYRMRGSVTVHEAAAFESWQIEEGGVETAVEPVAPPDEPADVEAGTEEAAAVEENSAEGKESA